MDVLTYIERTYLCSDLKANIHFAGCSWPLSMTELSVKYNKHKEPFCLVELFRIYEYKAVYIPCLFSNYKVRVSNAEAHIYI